MKKKLLLGIIGLCAGIAMLAAPHTASAAFNGNRLIDDGIFNNAGSMSAGQIDAFLNGFPNSCISPNNGFRALEPTGYSPGGGFTYGGNVTAGTVIARSAQVYGINPQVLLVTLQKEQSLVNGNAGCTNLRYVGAMGYGCPDSGTTHSYSGLNLYTLHGNTATSTSGTCVSSAPMAGFSQQVIRGAWLLKFGQQRSLGNVGWAVITGSWDNSDDPQSCYGGPMTEGFRQICPSGQTTYYDGLRSIDGQTVHMDTGGTASLYWYTPHFHGNQNFVAIYESWFGSPVVPNYSWQVIGQYAYTDQNKTTAASTRNLLPGARVYIGFKVRNTSNYTWSNTGTYPVFAGTLRNMDRFSSWCDNTWVSCNRPTAMQEATVAPGELATFEFWYKAPPHAGNYREYFGLLANGQAWFPDNGLYFDSSVAPPTYSWQPIGQYAYTDETKSVGKSTSNLSPGDRVYVGVKAVNTGNMPWNKSGANTVFLGTTRGVDRSSVFYDPSWVGAARPAGLVETQVLPGQVGTFEFWMTAKNTPGARAESFTPVVEGVTWMNDVGFNFYTSIISPNYSWQFMGQYSYTDQTKTTGKATTGLTPGDRVYVGFRAKNTGNVTWRNNGSNPINVGMTRPLDRLSLFFDNGWLGQNRPARMIESAVAPGETGTFEFWMKAPAQAGIYREYFSLVAEGAAWMNDPMMNYYMSVN